MKFISYQLTRMRFPNIMSLYIERFLLKKIATILSFPNFKICIIGLGFIDFITIDNK